MTINCNHTPLTKSDRPPCRALIGEIAALLAGIGQIMMASILLFYATSVYASAIELESSIAQDYDLNLASIFDEFHQNPELSLMEFKTAAKLVQELTNADFQVTNGIAGNGIVAVLKNGRGPTVMVRADMDALPVEENSGLKNTSKVRMKDSNGQITAVSHACGHDIHMTSLIGIAHQMVTRRNEWSGTLMLIGQPAEEIGSGAKGMMEANIWSKFGQPDYALALHVIAGIESGKIVVEEAPWSGVDPVAITIHGIGAHASAPSKGKDPVVLGAMIVLSLQEIISREISPYAPAVITVGSFHAGTKSNIIGDTAKLELSVRSDDVETRQYLLEAITRVTLNTARAFGIEENMLPEVDVLDGAVQPIINDEALRQRLISVWTRSLGKGIFSSTYKRDGMYGEDFYHFTTHPYVPGVYFKIGGTPLSEINDAKMKGVSIPSNHSPFFKVDSEMAIKTGVETTVIALLDLLKK